MHAVELRNITKSFGAVLANQAIDLSIRQGEIHCLLGENGAGKTTLMKILFGLYQKDGGSILINEQEVEIKRPSQAIGLGIGMIHQHFMLVDRLTVAENIIAGAEPCRGFLIDQEQAAAEVAALSSKYNLRVDPAARIENISVGEQQRVEILKALYRDAEILILDEPTAVLTPQETGELFGVMRELRKNGKTIIFITHKLRETMAISDRVTILRDGKKVGTVQTGVSSPGELARMMVGREVVLRVSKEEKEPGEVILNVRDLALTNKANNLRLTGINLTVREGEIVGIAGVEGNGQLELEEALSGLQRVDRGHIYLRDREITGLNTGRRRQLGLAHIPSDRMKRGLIGDFTLEKNLILGSEWSEPFASRGFFHNRYIQEYSREIIRNFDIRTAGSREQLKDLSGGNQQKVILARELSRDPVLIIAAQPTRGVDVGAIEYIHQELLRMREEGKGILLISAELDELRTLSDRILVIYEGRIAAADRADRFTEEELGLLMAGQVLEVEEDGCF